MNIYFRNCFKHYYHNTRCDGTNRTAEGEELVQMTSRNHRINFRSYDLFCTKPIVLKINQSPIMRILLIWTLHSSDMVLLYTMKTNKVQRLYTIHTTLFVMTMVRNIRPKKERQLLQKWRTGRASIPHF